MHSLYLQELPDPVNADPGICMVYHVYKEKRYKYYTCTEAQSSWSVLHVPAVP